LSATNHNNYFFLQGDGQCATLARSVDWASTSLGNPDHWPQSLRNTLALLFSSQFPMFLWWGDDLIQFYNDAYRPSLGNNGKHPKAMGARGEDSWPDIWDFIHPLIQQVRTTGKPVYYEDLLLPIFRNGQMEDVYWTFSYSAVYGDTGKVDGVLVVCTETTVKVDTIKNLSSSKAELEFAIEAAELGTWDLNPITGKFSANARLKTWFGLQPQDDIPLNSAIAVIAEKDRQRVLDAIEESNTYESGGKYEIVYTIIDPTTSTERVVLAKGNTWFDENKKPYRFNGTLQDVTDTQKSEAKIAEARRLTDMAIKSVGLGLFKIDFETGEFEYTGEFATIMTGRPNKNLTHKKALRYVHPDDMGMRDEAIKAGIETGELYYAPRVVWEDGSVHRVVIIGAQIADEQGNPTAFSGTVRDITTQEMQKLALAESENRFKSMIEQAPVATCLFTGREMKIEIANDTIIAVWGKDRSVIGKPLIEALPEIKGQPFLDILDHVFTTGETYEAKAAPADLVVDGKLQTFYFDFSYKAIRDTTGKIYGVMDMAIDVTKQVLIQRQIDEQQRQLLASFEEAPVAIATLDIDRLTFRSANKFYCELVGRKPQEIINKPLLEALPELQGQGFDELLQNVIATGEAFLANEVEAKLLRNGILETIYVNLSYQPRHDENEQVSGILVVATDVTEQVLSRKKVEDAGAALNNAVELAELATWKLDIKNKVFIYSARFMEWLGFSEDTKSVDEAYNPLPDEFRLSVPAAVAKVLEPGSSGLYDNEHPIINKITGQVRIIHANAQLYYDQDGNPEFLSGTAQDVTKERKLQQELEFKVKQRTEEIERVNAELATLNQSLEVNNQELQQFAYIASHDLQEPVRKIAVYMQLLEASMGPVSDKSREYMDKVNTSAKRMTNLVRDVLGFSQLSGATETFEPVDLNDIVAEIVAEYELTIEQTQAQITTETLPVIEGIPLQLSQLFGNLISNSLKYVAENVKPSIKISVSEPSAQELQFSGVLSDKRYCKLQLTDNGIGFEQAYAEKIFAIFQRLHAKTSYTGTGIGLAMCRKIAQNHHGWISAQSQPGAGATFIILLPLEQAEK
jgi:PAS domain S-box-containing protein